MDISLDDYDEEDGGLFGPADYRKLLKIQERAKMGQTAKSEATNWTTEKPQTSQDEQHAFTTKTGGQMGGFGENFLGLDLQ